MTTENVAHQTDGTLTIIIYHSKSLVRAGIRAALATDDHIKVLDEVATKPELTSAVTRVRPDIILLGVMPADGSAKTVKELREATRDCMKILLVVGPSAEQEAVDALLVGGDGAITLDYEAEDIIGALKTIGDGRAPLDPGLARLLLDRTATALPVIHESIGFMPPSTASTLSAREREVLYHLAHGAANSEIADALSVSEATVRSHLSHIFAKLNLRDRAQAVVFAYNYGLVRSLNR